MIVDPTGQDLPPERPDWRAIVAAVIDAAVGRATLIEDARRRGLPLDYGESSGADDRIVDAVIALRKATLDSVLSEWARQSGAGS